MHIGDRIRGVQKQKIPGIPLLPSMKIRSRDRPVYWANRGKGNKKFKATRGKEIKTKRDTDGINAVRRTTSLPCLGCKVVRAFIFVYD